MKKIILTFLLISSQLSFAGTGSGAVSCNLEDGSAVALYSWFHSSADSYSNLRVFILKTDGTFTAYSAINDKALEPLSIHTDIGGVTVIPDLQRSRCSIVLNQ